MPQKRGRKRLIKNITASQGDPSSYASFLLRSVQPVEQNTYALALSSLMHHQQNHNQNLESAISMNPPLMNQNLDSTVVTRNDSKNKKKKPGNGWIRAYDGWATSSSSGIHKKIVTTTTTTTTTTTMTTTKINPSNSEISPIDFLQAPPPIFNSSLIVYKEDYLAKRRDSVSSSSSSSSFYIETDGEDSDSTIILSDEEEEEENNDDLYFHSTNLLGLGEKNDQDLLPFFGDDDDFYNREDIESLFNDLEEI
jgi:hypothetical protein